MSKYSASLIFSADWSVDVEADSPEEAADIAYNSDEASVSVCHECAGNVNIGDCIRVIVYDENGTEVLDDGFDHNEIESLTAKVKELEATCKDHGEIQSSLCQQLSAEQSKVKVLTDALELWKIAADNAEESELDDMACYCIPMPLFCDADEATDEALATVKGE